MKHKIFTLFVFGCILTRVVAADNSFNEGDFTFTVLTETTVSIKGNNVNLSGELIIPSSVEHDGKSYEVVKIDGSAFYPYYSKITSVYIPASISSIGGNCFYQCTNLEKVTFAPTCSITTTGNSSFYQCSKLTTVYLPYHLNNLYSGTFKQCSKLTDIYLTSSTIPTVAGKSVFENITLSNVTLHVLSTFATESVTANSYFNQMQVEITPIKIKEEADNEAVLVEYNGVMADVAVTRTIRHESYNTICLPFAVSEEEVERVFGAGCDIEELSNADVTDEELTLTFSKCSIMEAGKPYLIQPKTTVVNPTFQNVTISKDALRVQKEEVEFIGVFSPIELAESEDLLFMGSNNTLSPSSGGTINGLRAYFRLNGAKAKTAAWKKVQTQFDNEDKATTLCETEQAKTEVRKQLENGRIILIRGEKRYNMQGMYIGKEARE